MGCINSLLPYLVLQLQPPLCKNIKKQFRESSTVTSCQGVFFNNACFVQKVSFLEAVYHGGRNQKNSFTYHI